MKLNLINMFQVALLALLLLIVVQDFKSKSFYTFLPISIFILGLFISMQSEVTTYYHIVVSVLINISLVLFLLLSLNIYVKLRFKNANGLLDMIGKGDVVLMVCLSSLFEYQILVLILITGSILGILQVLVLASLKKIDLKLFRIPFASWLSLSSIGFIITLLLKPEARLEWISLF